MLNWIKDHAVGLFRTAFALGAAGSALYVAAFSAGPNPRLLSVGVVVCAGALVVTLIARIFVWSSKKCLPETLVPMKWHELTAEQFNAIGPAGEIAFAAQNLGLFAAAFGFGWLLITMLFVIFGSAK